MRVVSEFSGPRHLILALIFVSLLSPSPAWAERYALLVGINDYQSARDLKGSVNDIEAIRQLLIKDLGFSETNIQVLLDSQATKTGILNALSAMSQRTKPGDSFLWYYSGHGFMMLDQDGDERAEDPTDRYDEVLVPYDAKPFPREQATDPNPTMISDDEIARTLAELVGRKIVVVFDSCHSGSGTRAVGDADTRSLYEGFGPPNMPKTKSLERPKETLDVRGSMVFYSAASPLQTASDLGEFEGRRHGAFTASLLRSLKDAGPGWQQNETFEGLFRRIRQDMLNRGFAGQTPTLQATAGLAKRSMDRFFNPTAAGEIADLEGSSKSFEVQLETNKYRFIDGEKLQVMVESAKDGYLYLFDINPEQTVTQLFPNRFTPENRIRAGQMKTIPDVNDRYQFTAGKPYGRSAIVAVVTAQPWAAADQLKMPTNFQAITDTQEAGLRDQLRRLQEAVSSRSSDPGWASQKLIVQTVSKDFVPTDEEEPVTAPAVPAAPAIPAVAAPAPAVAQVFDGGAISIDDRNLSSEEQMDLENKRPDLFAKLKKLAERYSPVFWQDVSGSFDDSFRPWKDFIVRYDFDQTEQGPNWPEPPRFQDEVKRDRNHLLDRLLQPNPGLQVTPSSQTPGMFAVRDQSSGQVTNLDLRPFVYWTVLTTPTHYFFHYAAFHAEDWKGMMGHTGDLEGNTIVVDRKTEKMVAAFVLAHDDVEVVRSLDDEPEPNLQVFVDPSLDARDLFTAADDRPIDGMLSMEVGRAGEPAPKEHQDIYVETKGHGQYGPAKIKPSRYIIYANYLDNSAFAAPPFDKARYPLTNKFEEVVAKHKYELVYIGSNASTQRTLWGEYRTLRRFSGGVNPPWNWRDNLFFKTGWWKDPRRVKKIGDGQYLINPYITQEKR